MKRKVIVACGGAVATSTMAAEEIKELCEANNIQLDLGSVSCNRNRNLYGRRRPHLYHGSR